ncbi:OmpA family protein [Alphaproteobacteria bacterium endosymbiont of Tiliacea citrago]|uniref:OmpA family protein n=1 Tax=Alphaproteobacteria bacterium endosymbiont of Tiliacea citrago TaxID=3077944 RepID=UPI00313D7481
MKIYNKYFICLIALLLVGCGKKKTVKSTSTTTTSVENENETGSNEVEFTEKSVSSEDEEASVVAAHCYSDLNNKFYFGYDKDSLKNSDIKDLDELTEWLVADENKSVHVVIYGNCDQRGSASYNMGLGARRANSVKKYFVSKCVSADRIKVISLGQTILVEGDSEEAYAKNRVAIVEIDGENSSLAVKKNNVSAAPKNSASKKEEVKNSEAKPSSESVEEDEDDDDE